MTQQATHTQGPANPLPWRHCPGTPIYAADGMPVHPASYTPDAEANAQFIVGCVNSHPDLLAALQGLLAECEKGRCFQDVSFEHPMVKPAFDAARAAIAKALPPADP